MDVLEKWINSRGRDRDVLLHETMFKERVVAVADYRYVYHGSSVSIFNSPLPNYTTNYETAMKLADEHFTRFKIEKLEENDGFMVSLFKDGVWYIACAPTVPEAISLAALKSSVKVA